MVTIARITEKLLEQKPFIQEALGRGIINNSALAEQLIPDIEKELKQKVKFSAVNMAVHRLSEKLEKKHFEHAKINQQSDITIRSGLIAVTVFKTADIQKHVRAAYDIVDLKQGDFLTITQGINEIMIITNSRHEKKLFSIIPKNEIKKTIHGLTSITINLPLKAVQTIGLFYIVTRAMAWENINIVDIVSTLTEMTIIIDEDDTARAFNTLKGMIKNDV